MATKKKEVIDPEVVEQEKEEVVETPKANGNDLSKTIARMKKLRRVIVSSRDPKDGGDVTDIYCNVTNDYVSYSRFIPLNVEVELPQAICDTLEETTFQIYTTKVGKDGEIITTTRNANKYNISYL